MGQRKKKSTGSKRGVKTTKETLKVLGTLLFSIAVGIFITHSVLNQNSALETKQRQSSPNKKTSAKSGLRKQEALPPKISPRKKVAAATMPEPTVKLQPPPVVKPVPAHRELPVPAKTAVVDGPSVVFVIDDIGNSNEHEAELNALGSHVTYAILPQLPYTRHFAELGRRNGAEIIVHLPMEADDGRFAGPGVLLTKMPRSAVVKIIQRDLGTVPYHVGVNNHMGSRGTSDKRLMKTVLTDLKKRNLFFLDSFTTQDSVAAEVGGKVGIPVLRRDVFLDNVDEKPAIREQIRELKAKAKEQGVAIGIGHIRKNTLEVLREEIPLMKQEGFVITTLHGLLE